MKKMSFYTSLKSMRLLFSMENWKPDINQHRLTANHKRCIISSTTSKGSDKIMNFLIKRNSDEEDKIITAEIVMASHPVYHYQSFSSNDCLNILLPKVFLDSKIASKFSSARMKSTAIIKNVIAPFTVNRDYQRSKCFTFFFFLLQHSHDCK